MAKHPTVLVMAQLCDKKKERKRKLKTFSLENDQEIQFADY